MTPFRPNPSLYRRLSQPRPRAEVEAAIAAFDADVQAARERHGIAELLIVCGAVVAPAPAEEGRREATAIATAHYGDPKMLPTLALAARNWARRAHMAIFDSLFAAGVDGGYEEAEDSEP